MKLYLCCGNKSGVDDPSSWTGVDIKISGKNPLARARLPVLTRAFGIEGGKVP